MGNTLTLAQIEGFFNAMGVDISNFTHREERRNDVLEFSKGEIRKMPKKVQEIFINGLRVHYRIRKDKRYRHSYEIQFRKKGYKINVSATTLEELKERFVEKLAQATDDIPKEFDKLIKHYLEKYKTDLSKTEYSKWESCIRIHLIPFFQRKKVSEITDILVHDFNQKLEKKAPRIAERARSILNQVFEFSIRKGIAKSNPLKGEFKYHPAERQHFKFLEFEETQKLFAEDVSQEYQIAYALMLYAGSRPCELESATKNGDYIQFKTAKQHNGTTPIRSVRINPMLEPFVTGLPDGKIAVPTHQQLYKKMRTLVPNGTLYDLRHTFSSNATMCDVNDDCIELWMGHSLPAVKGAYKTITKPEFQTKQALKFHYNENGVIEG